MDNIKVDFENIQALTRGTIHIKRDYINIKYGYNGLGKSSIGKAIECYINSKSDEFDFLKPYFGGYPKITIQPTFRKCIAFNSDYINNWLFQGDNNIINESYYIFFKNKEFESKEKKINDLLINLMNSLSDNHITDYTNKVIKINQNLKFAKGNTTINGNCVVGKGFKNGPAVIEKSKENGLKDYSKILSIPKSPEWLNWFNSGNEYIIENKCPYCIQDLPIDFYKVQELISNLLKDNDFRKNNNAKQTILDLASVSDLNKREEIEKINDTTEVLSDENISFIYSNYFLCNKELEKINNLNNFKKISISSIDKNKILEHFKNNKLDLDYFKTLEKDLYDSAKKVNDALDVIITNIEEMVLAIKQLNDDIAEATKMANNEINTFLKYAGLPYVFEIKVMEDNTSQTIIYPKNSKKNNIENVDKHLSYGELNAFSLALFGAIAKRDESDLVILDDPISSFDESKKFAVMHYLFNSIDGVLKDKTVLLLTHDMEPLLDMIRADLVKSKNVCAHLLKNNSGIVSEMLIEKKDLDSSINQELEMAKNSLDDYIKIIHLRRYYELFGVQHSDEKYQIASCAEHLKNPPSDKNGKPFDKTYINNGVNEIRKMIKGFDYDSFIMKYTKEELIKLYKNSSSNYDKICLMRPILNKNKSVAADPKLWNFITENYHIENMYLYGVFGVKQVPDYIIKLCDELIDEID